MGLLLFFGTIIILGITLFILISKNSKNKLSASKPRKLNKDVEKLIQNAKAEKESGNMPGYLNLLSQANLKDPTNSELKIELANAYYDAGFYSKAKFEFENFIKLENNEAKVLEALKKIFEIDMNSGNTKNSFITALKIVILSPSDVDYYNYIGLVLGAHSKYDDAINYLNKAIEIDPKNDKAFFYRGLVFAARGWKKESYQDLEKSISLGATDVRATFICGLMIRETDKSKAIKLYLEAFNKMEKLITSEGTLILKSIIFCGVELIFLQQFKEAVRIINKISDIHVNDVIIKRDFRYHLGYAYLRMGNKEAAIEQWNILTEFDENFIEDLDYIKFDGNEFLEKIDQRWFDRVKELKFNYFDGLVHQIFSLNLEDILKKVKSWFQQLKSGVVDVTDMKKTVSGKLTSETLRSLNMKEFKKIAKKIIVNEGLKIVKNHKVVGNDEIFYIAKENKFFGAKKILVTLKRWDSPVGEIAIDEFAHEMKENKIKKGIFLVTSEINAPAKKFAKKSNIIPVDKEGLNKKLAR